MADLAFKDKNGVYYIVDVKTHRTETKFNMPNLTSVERIAKFYEEDEKNEKDSKFFTVLFISYNISGLKVEVSNVIFAPIEYISWKCLTIGALGWGQIQIVNSNEILLKHGYSRKQWMLELCDVMLKFYPKEIEKIGKRISRFQTVKSSWENKIE